MTLIIVTLRKCDKTAVEDDHVFVFVTSGWSRTFLSDSRFNYGFGCQRI